jgi:hypothetical protein
MDRGGQAFTVKSANPTQTLVAQASKPAVSQPLSCSVNGEILPFRFRKEGSNERPERPPQDSPGQRPGFDTTITIKRCKRATILLLTRRHSNVVAQVSKPAFRGLSKTDANVYAPSAAGATYL